MFLLINWDHSVQVLQTVTPTGQAVQQGGIQVMNNRLVLLNHV